MCIRDRYESACRRQPERELFLPLHLESIASFLRAGFGSAGENRQAKTKKTLENKFLLMGNSLSERLDTTRVHWGRSLNAGPKARHSFILHKFSLKERSQANGRG